MKKIILFVGFLFHILLIYGQQIPSNKVTVSGKIIDSISKQPIEFATISFEKENKLLGTTSDKDGHFSFNILPGKYKIKIEFLSYEPIVISNKEVRFDTNLGIIHLFFSSNNLEEITLISQRDLIEFKVDKKIYNASKDIANFGGNAITVLNNTPAVRVDDEGNVSLRGSGATVLIDGKPLLGLDSGMDILGTIPSNSIDKVEIISRSAKYSAEGGGGILNIVTKKRKSNGLSGSLDAHLGSPDDNGISSFLNENTDKINIFSTISFNNEKKIKKTKIDQIGFDMTNVPLSVFEQFRKDENQRNSFLFNLGSDFYINDKNTITSSVLINTNNKNDISNIDLNDKDPDGNLLQSAIRSTGDFDDVSKIETFFNYTTKFNEDGHQLSFDFKYDNTISENKAKIIERKVMPVEDTIRQNVDKNQTLDNFLFQLDYVIPTNETNKIELGYKSDLRFYENNYKLSQFDETLADFITIGGFNDIINYDEKIHAIYGQYAASKGNLSYSLGVRTEFSHIGINEKLTGNNISKNYTDFFPSLSLGYEFKDGKYLSLHYSRSIERPSIAQLNPFISINDERFQSLGNPNLNPYYQHYFELLFDMSFDKLSLASAIFLNNSKDHFLTVIENIGQNSDGLDIFRRIPINSGDKNIMGFDVDITYRPVKSIRLGAYITPYKLDIINTIDKNYDYHSWVLYAEASALFTVNDDLRFQVSHKYQSPIKNALTELRTIHFTNATLSKDIFKKNATLTFKIIDIFNSKWFTTQSYEASASTLRKVRYNQQYSLSFTYRFNQKRKSAKDRSVDINSDELEDKQDKKM